MGYTKIFSISLLCLSVWLVAAQLDIDLEADKTEVPVGEKVNLKCIITASEEDFEKAVFSNNGVDFFTFTKGDQEGEGDYTPNLEPVGANSSVSIAVKATKCGDDKADDRKFECKVTAAGEEDTDEVTVKFTGDDADCPVDDDDAGTENPEDATVVTTVEPSEDKNNGTATGTGDNLGLYGSAIAFITILIVIVCLGLIGLWHLASTRKTTSDAKV